MRNISTAFNVLSKSISIVLVLYAKSLHILCRTKLFYVFIFKHILEVRIIDNCTFSEVGYKMDDLSINFPILLNTIFWIFASLLGWLFPCRLWGLSHKFQWYFYSSVEKVCLWGYDECDVYYQDSVQQKICLCQNICRRRTSTLFLWWWPWKSNS